MWNESFSFDIEHGDEPLGVAVYDKDTFGQDDFEGECKVDLNDPNLGILDQRKVDIWCDLHTKDSDQPRGRIRLQMQWIYSRYKYFDDYVTEWEQAIHNDVGIKEETERRLKQLESPFGFLDTIKAEAEEEETDNEAEIAEAGESAGTAAAVHSVFKSGAVKEQEAKVLAGFE